MFASRVTCYCSGRIGTRAHEQLIVAAAAPHHPPLRKFVPVDDRVVDGASNCRRLQLMNELMLRVDRMLPA